MSTEAGRLAESQAASYLESQGFRILARNWRSRWSELDLIAEKARIVHIIEVKYRRRPDFGTGFDYITGDKKRRLLRAAQAWIVQYAPAQDWQIGIVAVSGDLQRPKVEYLENAIVGA